MSLDRLPVNDKLLAVVLAKAIPSDLNCPVDATLLRRFEVNELTLDTCTSCRGIWLDDEEQERLLTRYRSSTGEPISTGATAGGIALGAIVDIVISVLLG
jgi:hypothetical protein